MPDPLLVESGQTYSKPAVGVPGVMLAVADLLTTCNMTTCTITDVSVRAYKNLHACVLPYVFIRIMKRLYSLL